MRPCVSTSFDHPSMRFATRPYELSVNEHSPPIAVNAEDEEFCSFSTILPSKHCSDTQ